MATPKKPATLAKIIGDSLTFKDDTGNDILVPANQEASKLSLMVLAAQLRSMLQSTIKNYNERGIALTPAEIKQLAESGKVIAQFQGEVYNSGHQPPASKPKPRGMESAKEEAHEVQVEEIDFSSLGKKGPPTIDGNS